MEAQGGGGGGRGRIGDGHPEKGNGDSQKASPHPNDGGRAAPSAHQALGEWIEMKQNPDTEEDPAQELAPLRAGAVDGPGHRHSYGDEVHHHDGERRNK